jgi:hypothetical protein
LCREGEACSLACAVALAELELDCGPVLDSVIGPPAVQGPPLRKAGSLAAFREQCMEDVDSDSAAVLEALAQSAADCPGFTPGEGANRG